MLTDEDTLEDFFVDALENLLRKGKQMFFCLIVDVIDDGLHDQSGLILLGLADVVVLDIDYIALFLVGDIDLFFYLIEFEGNCGPVTNLHGGEDHLTSCLYVLNLIGDALAFAIRFGFVFFFFVKLLEHIVEPV